MQRDRVCLALAVLAIAACGGGNDAKARSDSAAAAAAAAAAAPPKDTEDLSKVDTAIAPKLGVKLASMKRLPDGLYVQDKRIGSGARADSGKWVRVLYTGWLANGVAFDSSRDRKKPHQLLLGYQRVVPGLEEGIRGMRVGGRRLIVIPPSLGYGKAGEPGRVPSRATMIFDVELVQVP
jgi:FKBP-type peptidyl-prolyl cis-trans isomerase